LVISSAGQLFSPAKTQHPLTSHMQSVASSFVSEAGPDGGWDLEPTEWDQSGMGSSTLVVDDEDSSGRSGFVTEQHNLVPHGVIGAEYRSLKASANGAVGIASLPTPQRDPYHGRCVEPRCASHLPPLAASLLCFAGRAAPAVHSA